MGVRHDLIAKRAIPKVYDEEVPPPGVQKRWLNQDILNSRYQRFGYINVRGGLNHTNGGSGPGSLNGAYNWANQWNDNTKPWMQAQRDGSAQCYMPMFIKGIANYRADYFFLAIETQDLGWPNPGGAVGYSPEQADTLGAAWAYAHLVKKEQGHHFPLEVPKTWDGAGIGSHTDPFGTGYWTKWIKPCPGDAKKAMLRTVIIPTAQAYVAHWTGSQPPIEPPTQPTEEDDDMKFYIAINKNGSPDYFHVWNGTERFGFFRNDIGGFIGHYDCYNWSDKNRTKRVTTTAEVESIPGPWIGLYGGPPRA